MQITCCDQTLLRVVKVPLIILNLQLVFVVTNITAINGTSGLFLKLTILKPNVFIDGLQLITTIISVCTEQIIDKKHVCNQTPTYHTNCFFDNSKPFQNARRQMNTDISQKVSRFHALCTTVECKLLRLSTKGIRTHHQLFD